MVFELKEGAGAKYTATIIDSDGTAIPLTAITTIALTLYNRDDESIIKSRNNQDVKNKNDVTIHATSGLLTWLLTAADNPIIDGVRHPKGTREPHIALFEFSYTGEGSPGKHEITLMVKNLGLVP